MASSAPQKDGDKVENGVCCKLWLPAIACSLQKCKVAVTHLVRRRVNSSLQILRRLLKSRMQEKMYNSL